MKIKAVLFDLDNTLVDFIEMKRNSSRAAAHAMVSAGLAEDPGKLSKELFEYYLNYWIEADNAFEKFLRERYGAVDIRVLASGVNAYLKEKYKHMHPYPGVKETLREIKGRGYKTAVVSDGTRLKAWMRLCEAGIDKFFDTVVTFDDTGHKKPSSQPFLKAAGELSVAPAECLFVGDWPERDSAGAKAVGMKTCLARYGCRVDCSRCEADYCIDSFPEILTKVRGL